MRDDNERADALSDLQQLRGLREHLRRHASIAHEWVRGPFASDGTPCLAGWRTAHGCLSVAFWKRHGLNGALTMLSEPNGIDRVAIALNRAIARAEEFEIGDGGTTVTVGGVR